MSSLDLPRPRKLYRYAPQALLERSLSLGEFRLSPAAAVSFLTLNLSCVWDERLFDDFAEANSCLVIHDTESFGERLHRATQRMLPNWAGIDAAVAYGAASPLGAAFTKDKQLARQKEWLFAWRPMQSRMSANPVVVTIGNIESIAELRARAS